VGWSWGATEVREAIGYLSVVVYLGRDGSQRSNASGSVATPRINISDHISDHIHLCSQQGDSSREPVNFKLRIHDWWSDEPPFHALDCSPDDGMLAGTAFGTVKFWNKAGERIAKIHTGQSIRSVQFSPDCRSLVTACGEAVRLWNLHPDLQHASWVDLGGHIGDVNWATFSPDGLYIASASDDGTIRIWSAGSGQSTVQPLPVHEGAVSSVAISHDSAFIVSGSGNKSVRVWNAHTGAAQVS